MRKMKNEMTYGRMNWIDWMKSVGMYAIVLGHFVPIGYSYLLAFSLPLFFMVSGFLFRRESDIALFWRKQWFNLVVPTLIICALNFSYYCWSHWMEGDFTPLCFGIFVFDLITGFNDGYRGLATCWFVYTLLVLRIMLQFVPRRGWGILLVALLIGAYVFNEYLLPSYRIFLHPNALIDVMIAYPFFLLGYALRRFRKEIDRFQHRSALLLMLIASVAVLHFCVQANGTAFMHRCHYGESLWLCLLGGVAGTFGVFSLIKMFTFCPNVIRLISTGTLLILGFHSHLIRIFRQYVSEPSLLDYVVALMILAFFVPIILLAMRYFPLIMGKMRVDELKR